MAPRTKSSSHQEKETLRHFTHPQHVLMKQAFEDIQNEGYDNDEFVCDGCGMDGSGVRYHCKQCGFDLHEDCATCPEDITSYIHPNHPLQRMWKGPDGQSRPCNVCGDQVKGLFYKCSSGAAEKRYGLHYFFIHPVCSKLQLQMRHSIDANHPLKLQSVPVIREAWCAICRKLVSSASWSYRCDPCGVNIHPQCITLPYQNVQSSGTRSSENQSSGTRPYGNQSSGTRPYGNQSSGTRPSGNQSSGTRPSGNKSSGTRPSGNQSSGTRPYGNQSSGTRPSGNQSSGTRPSGNQSSGTRSSAVSQVEQAAADADALAAAMYATKISAKSNKNILDCI